MTIGNRASRYLPPPELARLSLDEANARYAAAAAAFRALVTKKGSSQAELEGAYERDVFPLALYRAFLLANLSMGFDALYLTAGTQPYSQALSIVSTPARHVVFIATDDPKCQECVRRAIRFACLPEGAYEIHTFAEPFSVTDMVREIYSNAVTRGDAPLAMDITSGRKIMSAALSCLAAELDMPQFYLNGEFLHGGFALDEQRLPVPNVSTIIRNLRAEAAPDGDEPEEDAHV